MTRILPRTAGRPSLGFVILLALVAGLCATPAPAQTTCPTTLWELEEIIDNEADPAVRAEAAECFVEKAIDLSYQELKHIVHKMLKDEASAEVRYNGLAMLGASLMAGQSFGFDITESKAKIIRILNEDPVSIQRSWTLLQRL